MKNRNNKPIKDLNEEQKKETENQNNYASIFEKSRKNLEQVRQIWLIINKILKQRPDCPEKMVKATRTILSEFIQAYGTNKDLRYLN
jgi:hypothetical protein